MDIYNLGKINSTIDGVIGPLLHSFNIIGVHGRPIVTFSFDTQEEAEIAHKAMRDCRRLSETDQAPCGALSASRN